jgi:hypothetical protein
MPEPSTRYDEYGRPFKADAPPPVATRPVPPRPQTRPEPRPAEHAKVYDGSRPPRGPAVRALLTLFVIVLLVAVPLTAGVISYYLTTDHWPSLLQDWFGSGTP